MKIKHYTINGDSFVSKKDFVIKNFYTQFNFIKGVTFNDTDASIIFQVGNEKDGGKKLFYCQLRLDPVQDTLLVTRYEYLYPDCRYQKDPEDYNADIAVLTQNRIYVVCETDDGRLKGFYINPNHVKFTEFYFYDFDAKEMRYPQFAKFGQSLGLFYTTTNDNNIKKISEQIINFPDCQDYTKGTLLPRKFSKSISLGDKYHYLRNPLPANRASEKVSIRFIPFSNLTIKDEFTDEEITPNVDYSDLDLLKIIPKDIKGKYKVEFITT